MDPRLHMPSYHMYMNPYSFTPSHDSRTAVDPGYTSNMFYTSRGPAFDRSGLAAVPLPFQKPEASQSMRLLLDSDPLNRTGLPRRVRQLFEQLKSSASLERPSASKVVATCREFFSRRVFRNSNPLYRVLEYLETLFEIVKTREDFLLESVFEAVLLEVEKMTQEGNPSTGTEHVFESSVPIPGRTNPQRSPDGQVEAVALAHKEAVTVLDSATVQPRQEHQITHIAEVEAEDLAGGFRSGRKFSSGKKQPPVANIQTGSGENVPENSTWGKYELEGDEMEVGAPRPNDADELPWVSDKTDGETDPHHDGYDDLFQNFGAEEFEDEDADSEMGHMVKKAASNFKLNDGDPSQESPGGGDTQHFKDPAKEQQILELMEQNQDILAKANLNRKKKRAILNDLRVSAELSRQTLKEIVTKIIHTEPTPEEKQKFRAKKVRMEERMKTKKEKLKSMTKEERKLARQVKKAQKEAAVGNLIRDGFQILSKQLEARDGIQVDVSQPEPQPKKRKRLGTAEISLPEDRPESKKSRRKEELGSYLEVQPKQVKLKVTEDNEPQTGSQTEKPANLDTDIVAR